MYLMYVDESGDCGLVGSPTQYFVLTGLVVHETKWHERLAALIDFRRRMRVQYGLKLREEIHAAHLFTKPGDLVRIAKHDRLTILRALVKELAAMPDLSVVNIVVRKSGKSLGYNPFEAAWTALVQRFENTIAYRNFPGPQWPDECGLIVPDQTDEAKLRNLMRKMRRFNPIPNTGHYGLGYRNMPLARIVEDPILRDSKHSYFIQACDALVYVLYQQHAPNKYMREKGGHNFAKLLAPIYNPHVSSGGIRGVKYL